MDQANDNRRTGLSALGLGSAAEITSLDALMAMALALEQEAVIRYRQLAAALADRGDADVAATLSALGAEEQGHVTGIALWARDLLGTAPAPERFAWPLPAEIAGSWEELSQSTTLTPYKALSLAVRAEEQAFTFYVYVGSLNPDPAIKDQAEALAREELRHAAALRIERRKAYHRERGEVRRALPRSVEDLADFAGRLEREAASRHLALAERLEHNGDGAGGALLRRIAAEERGAAAAMGFPDGEVTTDRHPPARAGSLELLREGLRTAELLAEHYAELAGRVADGEGLVRAQALQEAAVHRLILIAAHLEATQQDVQSQ
ncbi:MAG: ferritin family protein [Azospirillaceae bacterium]|nr:ferritin family protein [Azospirillaceae bacterium]